MIAFHSGDNCVPYGRSDGTILQFATKSWLLLAIGGIKPNSKWTPVDPARWYHDPKNSQITQAWELEGRLILRENLIASLRQIFSNRPPLSLEKSTTVSALFTTCTVQRLGAADRVNLASDWLIRCVNTCTYRFVTLRFAQQPFTDGQGSSENLRQWGTLTAKVHGTLELYQMMNARFPYALNLKLLMRRNLWFWNLSEDGKKSPAPRKCLLLRSTGTF